MKKKKKKRKKEEKLEEDEEDEEEECQLAIFLFARYIRKIARFYTRIPLEISLVVVF